jgi:hypothetical protein
MRTWNSYKRFGRIDLLFSDVEAEAGAEAEALEAVAF